MSADLKYKDDALGLKDKAESKIVSPEMEDRTDRPVRYILSPGMVTTSVGIHQYAATPLGSIELNESAAFYIECLKSGASMEDLIESACARYEIPDRSALRKDIDMFIRMSLEKHLITEDKE